jgi:hypothetical protein
VFSGELWELSTFQATVHKLRSLVTSHWTRKTRIAIRVVNQKNPQPRHLWFMQMEPWHQKHAE